MFNCNPNRKHVKHGHWWHKHKLSVTTEFEMNAQHNNRWSDQVFKMLSTSFHTSSSVRNMKSTADAGKRCSSFVCEFVATHSLQQWVLAHDASSSISTSNSDEWHIPKSGEFLSLVNFDVWLCDSGHISDSKSIHWQNQRCHQCAHCEIVRFLNAFLYCQCFSIFNNLFRPETVKPLLRNSLCL